jgi:hypothetical protein
MTRTLARLTLAAIVSFGLVAAATAADEVTLKGKIVCAKCTLKKADVKECQDALVVSGANAGDYYLVKNEVLKKFGHVCMGEKRAVVTGTISEKNGQKWIEASKIEAAQTQS